MLTHIVRHIFGTTRPTNFKLSIRMEDDDSHQPQAPRSKVKVTRSRDQSEPSWPNAVPVLLEADGGIACRPNPVATLPIEIMCIEYEVSCNGRMLYVSNYFYCHIRPEGLMLCATYSDS